MKSKNVLIESYIALTRHAKIHHAINGFITKQGLYIPRSNLLEESGILQALYWKQFFQTGVNICFSFRKMGQDIIKSSWFYEMDMMSRTKGSQSEGLASISAMYKPCTTRNSDSRKKSLMSSSKMYSVMNLVYTRIVFNSYKCHTLQRHQWIGIWNCVLFFSLESKPHVFTTWKSAPSAEKQ